MVMMAREMEIRAEGREEGIQISEAKGRAEAQREAAEKIAKEFGISLEKVKEILTKN